LNEAKDLLGQRKASLHLEFAQIREAAANVKECFGLFVSDNQRSLFPWITECDIPRPGRRLG
jgi:hypothetical protein